MTSEYNLADQTLAALSAPKVGLISYESVPNICPSVARRNSKGERVKLTPHSRERIKGAYNGLRKACLLYTSPSPRDGLLSRMPSSA